MTWSKYDSEFWPECLHHGLSDAAARTHAEAIAYLYEVEETTCTFPKRLLRTFAGSELASDAVESLVALHWWKDRGDKWEVVHHAKVVRQSIAAQRKQRETSRKTSAAHRAKKAESDTSRDTSRRQTDRQAVTSGVKSTCKHGVPNGNQEEPWSDGLVCADCTREARGA